MLKLFTYHNLSKLRREWIELYNSNPNLSPFVEYDYFKRTIKYFWYYFFAKRCHIKYYLIRHNDSPILIAPILFFSNGKKNYLRILMDITIVILYTKTVVKQMMP